MDLQNLDTSLFLWINRSLSHPFLDRVMPWFSGNPCFAPAVVLLTIYLLVKGGSRGRLFVGMLALVLAIGDGLIINTLKTHFQRPRPFLALSEALVLVGRGGSGSFPSSHTSTWFAATLVAFIYFRKSWKFMLPIACTVGFSRVYVGVHYPSDVLGGALLGAGYAAALLTTLNSLWRWMTRRWMPDLAERCPSLVPSAVGPKPTEVIAHAPLSDRSWVRLGYLFIAFILLSRLLYIASGKIELSEDEAYQWLWSKHLALSYYSKPPVIAWLHWIGTHLWGDTNFGVRFCSPIMGTLLSVLLLRFMASTLGGRMAFWFVVLMNVVPLLAVGSTLITVDPPLVLGWTAAMLLGWRASQPDGTTRQWIGVGLCMGFATLSKYAGLYQLICWGFFFAMWPPARRHLKKPGPWLAALICLLCLAPVVIWNQQNGWVTVEHVKSNATRHEPWKPTMRFFWDFVGAEFGLLNPVLFFAMIGAMLGFRRIKTHEGLAKLFFCMGAPVFLGYLAFTGYKRVFPNWIAPSIIPLLCLSAVYWLQRWNEGSRLPKVILIGALGLGVPLVALTHDTQLFTKATGIPLSVDYDPLRRVQGWAEVARLTDGARQELLREGKPVFIIANHYGFVGEITFSLPEARKSISTNTFVYYKTSTHPDNQFYFWPGYQASRRGQNAIFMQEVDVPEHAISKDGKTPPQAAPSDPPPMIVKEFESIRDLGVYPVYHRDRLVRWIQLFACRNLL